MFSFINNFLAQVEQQAIEMGASTDSDGRRKEQQQKKQIIQGIPNEKLVKTN